LIQVYKDTPLSPGGPGTPWGPSGPTAPCSPFIFVTCQAPQLPLVLTLTAIQIEFTVAGLYQLVGLSVGLPGFCSTDENSKSISGLSLANLGIDQVACCGSSPVVVNILVLIYKGLTPLGTPSVQPVVVGKGDSHVPPVGVLGTVSLLMKAIDLNAPTPSAGGVIILVGIDQSEPRIVYTSF